MHETCQWENPQLRAVGLHLNGFSIQGNRISNHSIPVASQPQRNQRHDYRETNPRGCPPQSTPLQYNDFDPGFTNNALKLVVLITDAEPGGFCDDGDNGYQAGIYAQDAGNNCIQINAILVNDSATDSTAIAVMQNYYQTTCGWFEQIPADGTGIADAVRVMLYTPGACSCQ